MGFTRQATHRRMGAGGFPNKIRDGNRWIIPSTDVYKARAELVRELQKRIDELGNLAELQKKYDKIEELKLEI